jgi:2-hydroxy-3-keto-5-methylthiopentenyl-1-phosphate phosphatase
VDETLSGLLSRFPGVVSLNDAERTLELLSEYKKTEAVKDIVLAEITRKYDFYEKLFAAVFAERSEVTRKLFKIIDRGIKEKDNELVLAGLSSLSDVVSSSPLAQAGSLKKLR